MKQTASELRKAAASARAFADNLGSAELRRSFTDMARRWDLEADEQDRGTRFSPRVRDDIDRTDRAASRQVDGRHKP
jgi:hypothetical protein